MGIVNTGYVIIDRCYIHGLSTSETRRGVYLDLRLGTGAVIESVIEDIHESGVTVKPYHSSRTLVPS